MISPRVKWAFVKAVWVACTFVFMCTFIVAVLVETGAFGYAK